MELSPFLDFICREKVKLKVLLGEAEVLEIRAKEGGDREVEVSISDVKALRELLRGMRG